MTVELNANDRAMSEAADWFARLRRGAISDAEEAEFAVWLSADSVHLAAYEAIENGWDSLELVRSDPDMIARREMALRRRGAPLFKIFLATGALAASIAVIVFGVWEFRAVSRIYDRASAEISVPPASESTLYEQYTSALGERKTVRLTDGSIVTLDTDSAIRVANLDSTRLVMLERGQAFFEVAKDPSRPFIVTAGDKRVEAVGTAFDVRLENGDISVTLREGKVRVETAAQGDEDGAHAIVQAADLVPGTNLQTSRKTKWRVAKADVAKDLGWIRGQLIFDGEKLGRIVSEMNRYSATKIILTEPALADIRLSGVFIVGEPRDLAKALAAYKLVRIAKEDGSSIALSAP